MQCSKLRFYFVHQPGAQVLKLCTQECLTVHPSHINNKAMVRG